MRVSGDDGDSNDREPCKRVSVRISANVLEVGEREVCDDYIGRRWRASLSMPRWRGSKSDDICPTWAMMDIGVRRTQAVARW